VVYNALLTLTVTLILSYNERPSIMPVKPRLLLVQTQNAVRNIAGPQMRDHLYVVENAGRPTVKAVTQDYT